MNHRDLGPVAGIQEPPSGGEAPPPDIYHSFCSAQGTAGKLSDDDLRALVAAFRFSTHGTADDLLNSASGTRIGVPAGYTYLYQLAGHDVVRTKLEARPSEGLAVQPRNDHRGQLELETIFGGGPMACPFAYETGKGRESFLRLGQMSGKVQELLWSEDRSDLPRAGFDDATGRPATGYGAMTDVLVPDSRNDDNLILSQLTVLFMRFHNALVARAGEAVGGGTVEPWLRGRLARLATVIVWRRILRHDLMRRILHPEVHAIWMNNPPVVDKRAGTGTVSREFTFAAVRLAHSMVRNDYVLNDRNAGPNGQPMSLHTILRASSRHNRFMVPLFNGWKVDWSRFFPDAAGQTPNDFNWALRFGPHTAPVMQQELAAPGAPGGAGQVSYPAGISSRDLVREANLGLNSADDLAGHIAGVGRLERDSAAVRDFLDAGFRGKVVRDGLDRFAASTGKVPDVLAQTLAGQLPLSLYLMFEAEAQGNGGAHYGPLGSIIVAEAFRPAYVDRIAGALDDRSNELLVAAKVDKIRTMPELLAWIREFDN